MTRLTVGLIADTHGLLRPEALDRLRPSDVIVHAGDIGRPDIVAELGRIAPVTAIRGNVDTGPWAGSFPHTAILRVSERVALYVLHDIGELDPGALAPDIRAVICGHSHKPELRWQNGILIVNPGSAGPRRFSLPVSVGRLFVDGDAVSAELIGIGTPRP